MYLKQISRLSRSQGELATILVYPGYLPIFFAIFTFCSEVFAFMDLPFLPSPVPSCQILFRSLRVFLSVWWRHMYVISQPNFFIVFGRRLHKLEKLVSDPYLLFLANQNMLKLKPQKYTSRWKWWCVMSMKLLSYVNVYVKIQMYMSRYKCICCVIKQMYHSRTGYLQKIPVLRQNFPCRSCSVQFDCLLTVIFHKYPARQWYIYVCITENVL